MWFDMTDARFFLFVFFFLVFLHVHFMLNANPAEKKTIMRRLTKWQSQEFHERKVMIAEEVICKQQRGNEMVFDFEEAHYRLFNVLWRQKSIVKQRASFISW